ncbi:MAG: hypothetical protein A3I97_00690 [Candidatus Taylorbacteria bacterium RIFCSPLOWO2_02_FULL_44_35]|nr:MAG: hypothetical protein A3I97_00690 [Candidatus Taylorbacteria bacterium RIFCSPLOWO2_02_FULL_44_35]
MQRETADLIIEKIQSQEFEGLNIKKLKGFEKLFRVRKGVLRVIFSVEKDNVNILDIARRSSTTYDL